MSQRNEPCPCGSGRKYKNCCARQRAARTQWIAIGSVIVFVLLGAWVVGGVIMDPANYETPEGEWSEAHGHFHDAGGGEPAGAPGEVTTTASVAGEIGPDGKVWSKEHGHYHDAPPEAGVDEMDHTWSEEHGHWHHAPQWSDQHGHFHQPPESAADGEPGQVWSAEHGHFHDAPEQIEVDGMTLQRVTGPPADLNQLTKIADSEDPVAVSPGGDEATSDPDP